MLRGCIRSGAIVATVLLGLLSTPAVALEQGWRGEFPAAAGEPIDPQEALRVRLPDDIDQGTIEWLAVELDGMDVTPIVALEGTEIVVRPPRPLTSGKHRLVLAQFTESGEVVDRGSWEFGVGRAVAYQLRSDATLSATYRAKDGNIPEESLPENRGTLDGSLRLEASAGTGQWQVGASADGTYTNQPAEGADRFEGGNYLFTAGAGGFTAEAGQTDPRLENLIISSFQRRGLSLAYATGRQALLAQGFALRTDPVTGFEGIIGEPENRLLGGALTLRPFARHWEWLTLTGTYLTGKQGEDPGVAIVEQTSVSEGSAWSIGFVSGLFGQRLRLKGEYAATRFDPDGAGDASEEEPDEAYGGSAVWDVVRDAVVGESAATVSVGAEYQLVGPSFRSLANAGLPTDLEMLKAFTRLGIGGLSAEIVAGREEDNVDDNPLVMTGRTDLVGALVAYSPTLSQEGRARIFLGQPRLDLGYQQIDTESVDAPEGMVEEISLRSREWSAAVGSSYATWDWKAGYRERRDEDLTGLSGERRNTTADGSLGFRPWERLSLGLHGQRVRDEDLGTDLETTSTLFGADLSLVLIKDRLTARVAYQRDAREASDDSADTLTQTTDFNLDLVVRQASDNKPGITAFLKGQYQDIDDRVSDENDNEPYQIFLGVTIGWPASLSGTWR